MRRRKRKRPAAHGGKRAKLRDQAEALALLTLVMLAIGSGVWLWNRVERWYEARWPEASGTVSAHRTVRRDKHDTTDIVVSYMAGGRPREVALLWDANEWVGGKYVRPHDTPPIGAQIPVRYDPDDPSDAAIDHVPERHGGVFMWFGMAAMFGLWGAITFLRWRWAK